MVTYKSYTQFWYQNERTAITSTVTDMGAWEDIFTYTQYQNNCYH